jgi:chromosomal replication initiation ATPase DnaA
MADGDNIDRLARRDAELRRLRERAHRQDPDAISKLGGLLGFDFAAAAAAAPPESELAPHIERIKREREAEEARVLGRLNREVRLDEACDTSIPLTAEMRALVIADQAPLSLPIPQHMRPLRWRDQVFATHVPVVALEVARDWLGDCVDARPVLLLCGTTGVGKTVAAADAITRTEGARYVKAKRLVGLAAAQYGEERAAFVALCRSTLLVIDEIGLEKTEAGARESLHEILDERVGKRTMIIGNLSEEDIRKRLDARTLSRLDEVGAFIDCAGPDLRALRRTT